MAHVVHQRQLFLDFDAAHLPPRLPAPSASAPAAAAEPAKTSEPKPDHSKPLLVRPDRQFTFDGKDHWDWPRPTDDRDAISVDRLRDDIDGPSHRFVIRRGDTVEVFFSRDKLETGEVVGISNANQEVRVRFTEGTDGQWFAVGQIYPAPTASAGVAIRGPG